MRFKESRPYAKNLLAILQELQQKRLVNPSVAFKTTTDLIAQSLRKEGAVSRLTNLDSESMTLFTLESMEALAWAQWSTAEAQLYCFDNNLIEAFKNSSALELSINNLRFPFEHSYFHFGTQMDMPLHDGILFVEGAYVFYNNISLRIILCGTWQEEISGEKLQPWYKRGKECYDLRIPSSSFDLPLEDAIDSALKKDIDDLKSAEIQLLTSKIPYVEHGSSQNFIESHIKNRESYTKALSLITNALCYLTAYPHDEKVMWQHGAPPKLVNFAENGKPKEKFRSISKLKSLGFSIIRQVGEEFGLQSEHAKNTQDEHGLGNRRVHWRRGHWRMQPYGPQNSLRRLTWITPVRVGIQGNDPVSRIRTVS
jgi:hypothetical protein